jgi:fructose-specific PTS system IIA-like component
MIQWELDVTDKNEVIKKMVDNLWLHRRTDARDKLYQDIWARENPFPTVVGSGFAIHMPEPLLCTSRRSA